MILHKLVYCQKSWRHFSNGVSPLYKGYRLHLIQGQNSVMVIKGSGEGVGGTEGIRFLKKFIINIFRQVSLEIFEKIRVKVFLKRNH